MLCALVLTSALVLQAEAPTDRDLERLWESLDEGQRAEALEWFRFEVTELDTLQMRLVRGLLEDEPQGAADWPAPRAVTWFDEARFGGKRAKKRKLLSEKSSKLRGARRKFRPEPEGPQLDPAFVYDWGRGAVVCASDPEDGERVFRNALLGVPPGLDLAQALCLRRLDGGEQREALAAFGHAYVDRRGGVFPGITLFEVWRSGETFEVPDTDALGLVRALVPGHASYSAPLSSVEQRELYRAIEERFRPAYGYRDLRVALAVVLLQGEGALPPGFEASRPSLHALWAWSEEDALALARSLPDGAGWWEFMEALPERVAADEAGLQRGRERWGQLLADGQRVRALMAHVLAGTAGR